MSVQPSVAVAEAAPGSVGLALREHWPEYLIEAAGLGLFMVSAGVFGTLLWAPGSPLESLVADGVPRRALMGVLMGLTAVLIIYSPFGQRSGAHLNPALTLTFWWLGKIERVDAVFYMLAQTLGGTLGVLAVLLAFGPHFAEPPVTYVATMVGEQGAVAAVLAEALIAFVLMLTVLAVSNSRRFMRATGLCAGLLLVVFITFEAPYSGMSLNPARSLASALPGLLFDQFWVYVAGPLGGMLAAAALWRFVLTAPVICCKLDHPLHIHCIFRCGYCQHTDETDTPAG